MLAAVPWLHVFKAAISSPPDAAGGGGLWNTDLDIAMPAELCRFSTVLLSHARHRLLFPDPVEAR